MAHQRGTQTPPYMPESAELSSLRACVRTPHSILYHRPHRNEWRIDPPLKATSAPPRYAQSHIDGRNGADAAQNQHVPTERCVHAPQRWPASPSVVRSHAVAIEGEPL